MRSLFVRIFLWFWVAFLVLGAVLVLAQRQWAPPRELPRDAVMQAFAAQAEQRLARGERRGLYRWLRELNSGSEYWFFLIDAQGRELTGRDLPPQLARQAQAQARGEDSDGRRPIRTQPVAQPDGETMLLVAMHPPGGYWRSLPSWVRMALAAAVSGLVSLGLAAGLAAPIRRIRQATRRLAEGDFDARVSAGGPEEIAGLGQDFNAMAERVQTLVESQGRLLRDVSHELRSPLARLQVALELARRRGGPAGAELDRIELETERLNELIGQVLALARLETSALRPAGEPLALGQLLAEVVEDADFEAAAAGKSVRLECLDAGELRGDPGLLRSALENIVRNAVRYTGPDTAVAVRLWREGDRIQVEVADQGPGVPEEALARIFEPFVRVSEARERASGGYGLGLAIARRAVVLHGGAIQAANQPQGGLRVTLSLPVLT